jgi:methyltransferase
MNGSATLGLYLALVAAVGCMRLFELRVSKQRQRVLVARGMPRVREPHFRAMVALHTGVLAGCALEAALAGRAPIPARSAVALVVLLGAQALRLWVIATLGPHWNVQIMDSLSLGVVSTGPFRFIRHPNYVAVFLELLALPLVYAAWWTAALGGVMHLWVLRHRIAAEEATLLAHAQYRTLMADKPRFFPRPRGGWWRRGGAL